MLRYDMRLPANPARRRQRDVIFEAAGGRSVQERARNMTDTKTKGKFDALTKSETLEFKVPMTRLATACVFQPRDGHYYLNHLSSRSAATGLL